MKEIEKEAKELFERVMKRYHSQNSWNKKALSEIVEEELLLYNKKVSKIIEEYIYKEISKSFGDELPKIVPSPVKLSKMLYKNAKLVANRVAPLLYKAHKSNETISNLAMKLYEGYGFRDKEVLDVIHKLPKYLQEQIKKPKIEQNIAKQVSKLKTSPLKASYKQILKAIKKEDKKALEKAINVALQEKARYYANRIADTESHRARNLARAKDYLEDDDIEFVKFRMSSGHKITDICDYYVNLDVGYGRGIVPKSEMVSLPLHPHCHCRYDPYYLRVKKRKINNPEKYTLEQFSQYEQIRILGSKAKWLEWKSGKPAVEIWNEARPKYPIKRYSELFENSSRMQILTPHIVTENEKDVIYSWLDFKQCGIIRRYFYGDDVPDIFKQKALILSDMFAKYDSNLDKEETIYRGIRLRDKNKFDFFIQTYEEAYKNNGAVEIDLAPSSFTRNKKVAYKEFALAHKEELYSIVFILRKRRGGELYIKEFSREFAYQEEIIVKSHSAKYRVIDIIESKKYNKLYEIVIEEM